MGVRAIVTLQDKKQNVNHWSETTPIFSDLKELKSHIKETWDIDVSRAQKMYRDKKDGRSVQVGWAKDTWQYYDDTKQRFPATFWIEVQDINPYEFGDRK